MPHGPARVPYYGRGGSLGQRGRGAGHRPIGRKLVARGEGIGAYRGRQERRCWKFFMSEARSSVQVEGLGRGYIGGKYIFEHSFIFLLFSKKIVTAHHTIRAL